MESLETRALLAGNLPGADFSSLQSDGTYDNSSIIVRFRDAALTAASNAPAPNAGPAAGILAGSRSESLLSWMPTLQHVMLPHGISVDAALTAFRANPLVQYAEPNYIVHASATPNDPNFSQMWDMQNTGQTLGTPGADIGATGAWDVNTGSGSMVVAVIDTGVDYNHPDLAANMWVNTGEIPGNGIDDDHNGYVDDVHGYDFYNNDGDPMDDNGHGTHVAGTIGAVGNNGVGVTGINWHVQIMALKFLGADGSGTTSAAIEAINYAVANGARISNNSWGGDPPSQAMFDAISSAQAAGHIFVTAAGNGNSLGVGVNNDTTPFYPASYNLDNIVSVAASDNNDRIASFSNYGATSVDLAAPGVDILSTLPGGNYGYESGTSMATPHVTGVMALVWDAHPTWTYDQVIAKVLDTVDPLPQFAGVVATGGRLDAAAALDNPKPAPPPPPSGSLPVLDDFQDNQAQFFDAQAGNWDANGGRLNGATPVDINDLAAISTLQLDAPLPDNVEMRATLNADEGYLEVLGVVVSNKLTNAYLIFDYHGPNDFKFAGADMDHGQWVIGHRDASGWTVDASMSQTLSSQTDYDVHLLIENGNQVTLEAGGGSVSHTFANPVTGGEAGMGTRDASAHFDNVVVQQYVPPVPATLPFSDDFSDGQTANFVQQSGVANVVNGRLAITPFTGADGVATLYVTDPLPSDLQVQATINADDTSTGRYSNAMLIFDYQSPTDFKFAGAYVGGNQWLIGSRTAAGWVTDASTSATINPLTDYQLQLVLTSDGGVTLYADGVKRVYEQYTSTTTDGAVGMGTRNALARFDDFSVQEIVPPPQPVAGTLPLSENFDDGVANNFQVVSGSAGVVNQQYLLSPPAGVDAVSELLLSDPLPSDVVTQATVNMDAGGGGLLSNAFLIFDYQSPTDFKFAGAYAGSDQWLIGHRDGGGWSTDASVSGTIDALTDYQLQLRIENNDLATLLVDGVQKVSYQFADTVTDGALGLGTRGAVTRFDDFSAAEYVPPPPPPSATLPYQEDFQDGVADFLNVQSGTWDVVSGRYEVTPVVGGDGVSTLSVSSLPDNVEMSAIVNMNDSGGGFYSNAFLIFDYKGPTDFKFAGTYAGSNEWLIGHRDAGGWTTDATVGGTINPLTDYTLRVTLEQDGTVTLYSDGVERISYQYADVLTDGDVGLGTRNAISRFDDFSVAEFTPPPPPPTATLPYQEDFQDGVADFLQVQSGTWTVASGVYSVTPASGGDGVSTLQAGTLPSDLDVSATVNMNDASGGFYSNAFIIFDYQGPTDFKFAGGYAGSDQWLLGHRSAAGWNTDVAISGTIDPLTNYNLQLEIASSGIATLYVGGVLEASHQYADSLTDGDVGLGTRNAVSSFDNFIVAQPAQTQSIGTTSATTSTGGSDPVSGTSLLENLFAALGTTVPASPAGPAELPDSANAAISLVWSRQTAAAGLNLTPNSQPTAVPEQAIDALFARFAGSASGKQSGISSAVEDELLSLLTGFGG